MALPTVTELQAALMQGQDSITQQALGELVEIESVVADGDAVMVAARARIGLAGAAAAIANQCEAQVAPLLGAKLGASSIRWQWQTEVQPAADGEFNGAGQVRNVILVASGKGGVGKSTTAVNLALALAANGARVGLLDADIYGPSLPAMLGVKDGTRPQVVAEKFFVPVSAHGLQTMSMAYMATEQTPLVWRGPMAAGALQQLLKQTQWDDLDYLVVDMPPGTGDIQLTIAQQVPVAGAVIVTTPQDIALLDAVKGIEMFRKVRIPILGIVENMAVHVCTQCGHEDDIFGHGGAERIAEEYKVGVIGRMPLTKAIRLGMDQGQPPVVAEPTGAEAEKYQQMALQVAAQLAVAAQARDADFPQITIQND